MCSLKQLYSLNKSAPARPPPARHTIVNPQVTLFNSSPKRQLGSVGSPVPSFPLSPDCDFSWIGKTGDVKRRTLAAITWGGWHGLRRYGGGAAQQRMQPVMSSYTLVSIVLYLPHLSQGSPWNLGRRHDEEDDGLKDMDERDRNNDGNLRLSSKRWLNPFWWHNNFDIISLRGGRIF